MKNIINTDSWRRWTLGEAFAKITSATLQKQIGLVSHTPVGVVLGNFVIGFVQAILSFFYLLQKRRTPKESIKYILFSCLFGLLAFGSTMFSLSAYRFGGEVSVVVFIITLSIIPGAFVDIIFFKHRLVLRQWFGVVVGILGAYFVLGAPNLQELSGLPIWALLAFGTACTTAINQGFAQNIKDIDPVIKNFWGGLTTFALAICAFGIVGFPDVSSEGFWRIVWISVVIGFVVIGMWTCNVRAYRDGAHIAEKKLMLNGLYLTFAMIAGVLFYNESLTFGKLSGIPIFILASCLFDDNLWKSLRGLFKKINL